MSLVKDAIKSLAAKGKVDSEFTILGTKFVMEALTMEEQLITDGFVDIDVMKKKYDTEDRISTYPDMIGKCRSMAMVTFAIKKVNNISPVDETLSAAEQFKQRVELRDELMELGPAVIDQLIQKYNALAMKQKEFFADLEGNVGK